MWNRRGSGALGIFLCVLAGSGPVRAQTIDVTGFSAQVFTLLNQQRASNGLPALQRVGPLDASAQAFSVTMMQATAGGPVYLSHTSPNGTDLPTRLGQAGYNGWFTIGENIAAGQHTPQEVVDAWMNSPGHRANILDAGYRDVGIGVAVGPGTWPNGYFDPQVIWWTTDFGNSTVSYPPTPPTTPIPVTTPPPPPVTTPPPGPVGDPTLSQSRISFGSARVGQTAGPLCFTITNNSGGPLSLNSISVINCSSSSSPTYVDCTTVAGFQIISGGTPGVLQPGQSRDVCLTFTPSQAATFDSTVAISTNAPSSPAVVFLHGSGEPSGPAPNPTPPPNPTPVPVTTPPPPPPVTTTPSPAGPVGDPTLSRNRISFGSARVGQTAGPLCFTITNNSGAPLSLNSISVINCSSSSSPTYVDCTTVAGFQIISSGTPGDLQPGQSRDVCLTFTPGQAATFDSTVVISTNAPSSPAVVFLHGTGN